MEKVKTCLQQLVLLLVAGYQLISRSILLPRCRYYPSCSAYAHEAITRFGVFSGGYLVMKRLLRCHPFSKKYGLDLVPGAPGTCCTKD